MYANRQTEPSAGGPEIYPVAMVRFGGIRVRTKSKFSLKRLVLFLEELMPIDAPYPVYPIVIMQFGRNHVKSKVTVLLMRLSQLLSNR